MSLFIVSLAFWVFPSCHTLSNWTKKKINQSKYGNLKHGWCSQHDRQSMWDEWLIANILVVRTFVGAHFACNQGQCQDKQTVLKINTVCNDLAVFLKTPNNQKPDNAKIWNRNKNIKKPDDNLKSDTTIHAADECQHYRIQHRRNKRPASCLHIIIRKLLMSLIQWMQL